MGGFWFEFLRRVSQRGKQEKRAAARVNRTAALVLIIKGNLSVIAL